MVVRIIWKTIFFTLQTIVLGSIIVFGGLQFEAIQTATVNKFLPKGQSVVLSGYDGVFPFWGGYKKVIYTQSSLEKSEVEVENLFFQAAFQGSKHFARLRLKQLTADKINLKNVLNDQSSSRFLPTLPPSLPVVLIDILNVKKITCSTPRGSHHVSLNGYISEDASGGKYGRLTLQDLKKKLNKSILYLKYTPSVSGNLSKVKGLLKVNDDAGLFSEIMGSSFVRVQAELGGSLAQPTGFVRYQQSGVRSDLVLTPSISTTSKLSTQFSCYHTSKDTQYESNCLIEWEESERKVRLVNGFIKQNKSPLVEFSGDLLINSNSFVAQGLKWQQNIYEGVKLLIDFDGVFDYKREIFSGVPKVCLMSSSQQGPVLNIKTPGQFSFKRDSFNVSIEGSIKAGESLELGDFSEVTLQGTLRKEPSKESYLGDLSFRAKNQFLNLEYQHQEGKKLSIEGMLLGRPLYIKGEAKGNAWKFNEIGSKSLSVFRNFDLSVDADKKDQKIGLNGSFEINSPQGPLELNMRGAFSNASKYALLDSLRVSFRESFFEASGDVDFETFLANLTWHLYSFNVGDFVANRSISGTVSLRGDASFSKDNRQLQFTGDFHKILGDWFSTSKGTLVGGADFNNNAFSATIKAAKSSTKDIAIEDFSATLAGSFSEFFTTVSMSGFSERALKGNCAFSVRDFRQAEIETTSIQFGNHKIILDDPVNFSWSKSGWELSPMKLNVGDGYLNISAKNSMKECNSFIEYKNIPATLLHDISRGRSFLRGDLSGSLNFTQKAGSASGELNMVGIDQEKETLIWAALKNNVLTAKTSIVTPNLSLKADADIPLIAIASPLSVSLDTSQPFQIQAKFDGRVDDIQDIFDLDYDQLKGRMFADVTIFGTLNNQEVKGEVRIDEGEYFRQNVGIHFSGINAHFQSKDGLLSLAKPVPFQDANNGGGVVEYTTLRLGEDLIPTIKSRVRFTDASIINLPRTRRSGLMAQASGILSAEGSVLDLFVGANAKITYLQKYIGDTDDDRPNLLVHEKHKHQKKYQSADDNNLDYSVVTYDIHVQLEEPFSILGQGLDSFWTGILKISGTSSSPQYNGEFFLEKGTLRVLDKIFNVDKGNIIFDGDLDPKLYIESNLETSDMRVKIILDGDTSLLSKRITSDNNLTEQEILQRLFFNSKSATNQSLQALNYFVANSGLGSVFNIGFYHSTDPITHEYRELVSLQQALMGPAYLRLDYSYSDDAVDSNPFVFALGIKPTSNIKTELTYLPSSRLQNKRDRLGLVTEWGVDF